MEIFSKLLYYCHLCFKKDTSASDCQLRYASPMPGTFVQAGKVFLFLGLPGSTFDLCVPFWQSLPFLTYLVFSFVVSGFEPPTHREGLQSTNSREADLRFCGYQGPVLLSPSLPLRPLPDAVPEQVLGGVRWAGGMFYLGSQPSRRSLAFLGFQSV